ncbi:LamG-like jellyroll fold domain-containing protein [Hymenobacter latericus]|uniref:LamG-like jellyroll fold domain-containing protein n=1 Tax=Hymenobacter sp. YIM 151858-1 TaxID=2987688 RepID=UPI0022269638|nr:LamG-like jellyroll fold domain-containing protein [Hymenobacter sp. YIM 151858-1]UYZ58194.1 Ig-like domain-containing protein [Hymenobacter sp. YIM 151858-1]
MKKTYSSGGLLRKAALLVWLVWAALPARAQVSYSVQTSPFPVLSFPNRQGFIDVDKDGDLDLLYQNGNTAGAGIGLRRNDGGGNYTDFAAGAGGTFASGPLTGITFTHVVFGTVSNGYAQFAVDYDRDGDTDIAQMVNAQAGSLFRNNGNGTWSAVANPFVSIAIASRRVFIDVNNDGAIDMLFQDGNTPGTNIGVQINNGSGAFSTTNANSSGTFTSGPLTGVTLTGVIGSGDPSVFAVDYDNDGDSDLLTAPSGSAGTLYRNNGGSFAVVANPFPALSIASRRRFVDVDADGAVDMLYQDGSTQDTGIGLLLNNGSGAFSTTSANTSGTFTSGPLNGLDFDFISQSSPGLYASDYDNDSDTDLVEFTTGAAGRVLRQEGNPPLLTASTPADNATGIAPATNITLVFDKSVTKSAGNFYVVRVSDNSVLETIPVGDARVTGSGTTWVINPNTTLALGTAYAIRIDEGVFRDASNRAYLGIFDNTTLNFSTYNTATVATAAPTGVSSSGATLGGSVTADGGASVSERGVVYSSTSTTPTLGGSGVTTDANGTGLGNFAKALTGLTAGTTYYVRAYATNAAGTAYGNVLSFATPVPLSASAVITNVACFGGATGAISLTPSGGTAPYTYRWNDGITTQNRTGLPAGSYSVTITDANTRTATLNLNVAQPAAALAATASQTNVTTPGGANGTATATTTGGTAPFSYGWARTSAPAGSLGQTTATATGLAAGTYRATVTDANGCTTTQDYTILQPTAAPVVVAPANGSLLSTTTPAYAGTAAAGSTVTVFVDGTSIGTTPASAGGNWSLGQPAALSQGSHAVYAQAQLSGQLTSASSNTNTFLVDSTPPPAPVVTAPANGSLSAATPIYSGTAEPGATVTVLVDGSSIGTATASAGGTWNLAQVQPLAFGSHTVRARATDAAGNTGPDSGTNTFTVPNPATYTSSTAEQPVTGAVAPGSLNQGVLRVAVTIGGGPDLPLSAQSFSFSTAGSTAPADIATARVYYTGSSGTLATTTAFGGVISSPNGAFTVAGTQQLSTGVNYFWLVYDVAAGAADGNVLDATLSSLTVSGTAFTPATTAPAGSRLIIRTSRVAGTALRLAGGNTLGYVGFGNDAANPAPAFSGSYTQQAWIKPSLNTSSTEYYVLGNGTGNAAAPYLSITGNGRLEAGFGTGTGTVFVRTNPNALGAGWSHVAATYDADADLLTLYLNGEVVGTQASPNGPAATPVSYVGSVGTTAGNGFPGDLDEVSQWNQALSRTQIRQLRHLTLSGTEPGLVSYLQFNESGSAVTDVVRRLAGTLLGGTRVASTAPVGYGQSSLLAVTGAGNYTFAGTNAAINFTTATGAPYDVVVTRLEGRPLGTQVTDANLRGLHTPAYWIVNRYSTAAMAATITYTLGPADISVADAATPANLKLYKRESNSDGAFDAPIAASAANAAAGTVSFPVTSFSQTVIGGYGNSPLPVELVRFTAERTGPDALLRWTTAQEKNNAGFEVESSADGRGFRRIGRVAGQGTSTSRHDYQFTDANLARYASPVVYYRLRQLDTDGAAHYSGVVALAVAPNAGVSAVAFPNPATDELLVRVAGVTQGAVDCQLFDAQGRRVLRFGQRLTPHYQPDLATSVQHLPAGMYVLRVTLPNAVVNLPIVVRH